MDTMWRITATGIFLVICIYFAGVAHSGEAAQVSNVIVVPEEIAEYMGDSSGDFKRDFEAVSGDSNDATFGVSLLFYHEIEHPKKIPGKSWLVGYRIGRVGAHASPVNRLVVIDSSSKPVVDLSGVAAGEFCREITLGGGRKCFVVLWQGYPPMYEGGFSIISIGKDPCELLRVVAQNEVPSKGVASFVDFDGDGALDVLLSVESREKNGWKTRYLLYKFNSKENVYGNGAEVVDPEQRARFMAAANSSKTSSITYFGLPYEE